MEIMWKHQTVPIKRGMRPRGTILFLSNASFSLAEKTNMVRINGKYSVQLADGYYVL